MAPMTTNGFSGREAADVAGITYRQLDYWARTDLIRPSLQDARGSGSLRRYSYRDLIHLRLIRTLLDSGLNLERVRAAFDVVRNTDELIGASVVIAGRTIEIAQGRDDLIEIVNRRRGAGVLNFIALDTVIDQVDAAIAGLTDG